VESETTVGCMGQKYVGAAPLEVLRAPDVNAALIDIVAEHGGKSRDDAETYVRQLADDRRYLRDVY